MSIIQFLTPVPINPERHKRAQAQLITAIMELNTARKEQPKEKQGRLKKLIDRLDLALAYLNMDRRHEELLARKISEPHIEVELEDEDKTVPVFRGDWIYCQPIFITPMASYESPGEWYQVRAIVDGAARILITGPSRDEDSCPEQEVLIEPDEISKVKHAQ